MWWWALPTALLVGAAAWGVSAWLLQDLDKLPTLAERVSARIEAARTALAAAAGVGASVTLLLAVRRQRHQELATAHTTHDAAERRVTELYTKAVEQLGNAQAPVRLGGLYALERLAQDTPALRQTIVDVICSYLRMPYTPPREDRGEKIRAAQRAARTRDLARSGTSGGRDPQEERQVRLTAQRILTAHLRYDDSPAPRRRWLFRRPDHNPRHWPGIRLDLVGAVLIDFDLGTCRVDSVEFTGATFTGDARFDQAVFTGDARFVEATFTSGARFTGASFSRDARFGRVTVSGDARFSAASFTGDAWFNGATVSGDARFRGAAFSDNALFSKVTFAGDAWFGKVTFAGDAWFSDATFVGDAWFNSGLSGSAGPKGPQLIWLPSGLEVREGREPGVAPLGVPGCPPVAPWPGVPADPGVPAAEADISSGVTGAFSGEEQAGCSSGKTAGKAPGPPMNCRTRGAAMGDPARARKVRVSPVHRGRDSKPYTPNSDPQGTAAHPLSL
ncbi:pentapeptide repeat-containing protein [Nonomuraea spiralis]|uniref:Pentapeptide repeat-containing protein n=1 Tax=Nonomuraea spiralis TaxID=46182 RepID=A0ABV5IRC0_9ACTN|nr:pentapeptide repeat-containing protein [Nonomuraea spiralis]GGT11143.1 hypothetical protein GCM10010176_064620 [Nonomuraea spiralis]